MHGVKKLVLSTHEPKVWLHQFKLALINIDLNLMEKLQNEMPKFSSLEELEEAAAYIEQAKACFVKESSELSQKLILVKKNINFQKSTMHLQSRFDTEL
jgi:hypothetical protein